MLLLERGTHHSYANSSQFTFTVIIFSYSFLKLLFVNLTFIIILFFLSFRAGSCGDSHMQHNILCTNFFRTSCVPSIVQKGGGWAMRNTIKKKKTEESIYPFETKYISSAKTNKKSQVSIVHDRIITSTNPLSTENINIISMPFLF